MRPRGEVHGRASLPASRSSGPLISFDSELDCFTLSRFEFHPESRLD